MCTSVHGEVVCIKIIITIGQCHVIVFIVELSYS